MWSLIAVLGFCQSLTVDFIPSTRSPPPPRTQSFMKYLKSRESLVVFSGWDGADFYSDLWEFSLSSSSWQKIIPSSHENPGNPYTVARVSFGGFASLTESKFYIFGGQSLLGPENDFWEFDFDTMKWQKLKTHSPPSPRSYYACTSYEEGGIQFFVVQCGSTLNGLVNDLFRYLKVRLNCSSFQWEELPPDGEAPLPSFDSIVEYYDGQIFQAAGAPEAEDVCLPYLYSYSLEDRRWSVVSDRKSDFECRELTQSFVFKDELYIVFGWLFVTSEEGYEVAKISLKDSKKEWKSVKIWGEIGGGDGFSMVVIENTAYLFGGFSADLLVYTNRLSKMDLDSLNHTHVNQNFILPQPRSLHSMVVINSKLFVFAGINSGEVFNDLWTFDLVANVWEPVSAKGDIPAPRYLHASSSEGDVFVVWGGENLVGLRDDMFIFNSITRFWTELVPTSALKPSPAKGSCLVLNNFKVFIFGGQRDSDKSNELWEYDIGTAQFKLLSAGLRRVSFHHCWLEADLFYVSLGSNEFEASSAQIDFFNLSSSTWHVFHEHDVDNFDPALSSQVFVGSHLISIGGQSWFQKVIYKINVLGRGKERKTLESEIDFVSYASGFVYFNDSLYIFGGGCALGLTLLPEVGTTLLAKIKVQDICEKTECQALCSTGTYLKGGRCVACEEGTYADTLGSSKCKECRPGTFNNRSAASSRFQCIPCYEGSYNSESAKEKCKPCPTNAFCPIGSTSSSNFLQQKTFGSVQPALYQEPNLSEVLLFYRIFVSVPILFALACCLSIKKLRMKIQKFDLFDDRHYISLNEYMIKKKTMFGGVFSIFFIIGALLLTCTTVLSYMKANIQETKALVPLVILSSAVSSFQAEEISLQVVLFSYGGECEKDSACISSIKIKLSNIDCSSVVKSCRLTSSNACIIRVTCENGEVKTGGQVSFNLMESLSYSSGIEVNLTSSSSIPKEDSSVSTVLASESGSVLIGSVASEFYFSATPSLFQSDSNNWPSQSTGFHVSETNSPLFGSQYAPDELPSVSNLNIKVFVDITSTALLTKRLLMQDFIFFAGALLGTVSGLFGITGFAMSFIEKRVEKIMKRIRKKPQVENNNLENNFQHEVPGDDNDLANDVVVLKNEFTKIEFCQNVQNYNS